jgi:hypothetical protein
MLGQMDHNAVDKQTYMGGLVTKDQEVLMAVVLDYLQTSQKDARQSKACCNAILHLVNSLSTEQLQTLIAKLKGGRDENTSRT